jgi:hypothetical protein
MRYSWWKLEPRHEWVEPHWSKEDYWQPFAAQIPGEAIIALLPSAFKPATFHQLPAGNYRAFFFNPTDATEIAIGDVTPDASGSWVVPEIPIFRDWVVVLENKA